MTLRPPLVAALGAAAFLLAGLPASAKLPALSPEAQAKADETKAKTAWSDKVAAYKLCQSQDRVVAQYRKTATSAKPGTETPACTDPGPFAPPAASAPPLEAAGAHSPPQTAAQPPSSTATDAEQKGGVKK
jgi:hypothetical protein